MTFTHKLANASDNSHQIYHQPITIKSFISSSISKIVSFVRKSFLLTQSIFIKFA
ncbi:MAG: hypothetical protein Q8S84_01895 [bacterium]|nr:hypothetical protein [bacterium]